MICLSKKINHLLPCLLMTFSLSFGLLQSVLGQERFSTMVDVKDLNSLQSEVRMNAGTLRLSTHSGSKAEMEFLYSKEAWKPEVSLEKELLSIEQPEEKSFNMKDRERNEWDIKLPRALAGDLVVRMGAGEANLDLKNAQIKRVELTAGVGDFRVNLADARVEELKIKAGVGELFLDLSGRRSTNLIATINGGIGDLNLLLPTETGVRIKVNGLGSVDKTGFKKVDGYYVNEAYGHTTNSVEITVNGGLGSVDMALK